ncbi:hypothetical protein KZX46_12905 [Polymorphobacter sp. PAMC 29334]|nr:hypothetical protein [Polymorphobacter sp. PAMC 29334]QYE33744.1 hypothetical protein KZX46_12905 [Polymorphobacter sp. PAMC 29334]
MAAAVDRAQNYRKEFDNGANALIKLVNLHLWALAAQPYLAFKQTGGST